MSPAQRMLGWPGIIRLGLVQSALGAMVVLAISTLNRVMVVEYALPALIPGILVALHYLVQMLRPRFGHASDRLRRRTPWILGGLGALAVGLVTASLALRVLGDHRDLGLLIAVVGYVLIGVGAGAAGTSLLVLLARQVAPTRRPAAATILWIMMIAGFAITSAIVGRHLAPFSAARLIQTIATTALIALTIATLALYRLESATTQPASTPSPDFRSALGQIWNEPETRRFTVFVFMSMLAYSAEELLLEPFLGLVFGLDPGASTRLSGVLHGGAVTGMVLVGLVATQLRRPTLATWLTIGCGTSSLALLLLAAASLTARLQPLPSLIFALGLANGMFTVAAIGSMMTLAGRGHDGREGVRMGLWGGAQAIAFAIGGMVATGVVDLLHALTGSVALAYACVFLIEATLFVSATRFARAPTTKTIPSSDVDATLPMLVKS